MKLNLKYSKITDAGNFFIGFYDDNKIDIIRKYNGMTKTIENCSNASLDSSGTYFILEIKVDGIINYDSVPISVLFKNNDRGCKNG